MGSPPTSTSSSASPTLIPQRTSLRRPSAADKDAMPQKDSSVDIPVPVTYTPATHRVSKAKKGKRVHACEYPGCNKVSLLMCQACKLGLTH